MYRLGHRSTHHYLMGGALLAGVGLLVAVGLALSRTMFQSHTVLRQSTPVVRTVLGDTTAQQHVSKSFFTVDMPADWHPVVTPPVSYTMYSWAGTKGDSAARRLDIYIDDVPLSLAVNRLQAIQADGDHFDLIDTTSDNCVNFTQRSPESARTGTAPSKWSGVNFLCDVGNYERDVVATGSTEGVNITTLVGSTSGSHHILLVYSDNSANPDYTIFTSIIKSFRLT